jgi:TetR/AcrR family transcriptional regulator, lmrAB and yxaGH operons repressor
MGRKVAVENAELMDRLSRVFRDVGYEGASLTMLAKASGLKKASLYHRFPEGKEQMAREVLESARAWLDKHILSPLKGSSAPKDRIDDMVRQLDAFYSGGKQACLLNMLSSARIHDGPFTDLIQQIFAAWINALTTVMTDAGVNGTLARKRAERGVMMLQGSLVLSRGVGTTRPFRDFLKSLPGELLGNA